MFIFLHFILYSYKIWIDSVNTRLILFAFFRLSQSAVMLCLNHASIALNNIPFNEKEVAQKFLKNKWLLDEGLIKFSLRHSSRESETSCIWMCTLSLFISIKINNGLMKLLSVDFSLSIFYTRKCDFWYMNVHLHDLQLTWIRCNRIKWPPGY